MDEMMKNITTLRGVALGILLVSVVVGFLAKKESSAGGDITDRRKAASKIFKYCCSTFAFSLLLTVATSGFSNDVNPIHVLGLTYLMFRYSEKVLDTYIEEYR